MVTFWNRRRKKKERKTLEEKNNDRLLKDKLIRDIRTLFEQQQQENYYKPKRIINLVNNHYIEYESNGDRNRNLSLEKYLNKIKPCLKDIIIDLQNSDKWKIQLTTAINFVSSVDAETERETDSKSHNIKVMSCNDVNEFFDELFDSLRSKYQSILRTSMEGSEFIFDSVGTMCYKYHKINFRCGGSYIDSPDWIIKKKAIKNLKNKDDKDKDEVFSICGNFSVKLSGIQKEFQTSNHL